MKIVKIGKPRTKMDRKMSSFPIVQYRVTSDFGSSERGEVREARLIQEDWNGNIGLLYHPRGNERYACSSFELCCRDDSWKVWEKWKKDAFVNCG